MERLGLASVTKLAAMRRVAVTGLGAVTPLGNDAPSTWRAAIAGESGIDFIKSFDASEFPVRIAAEVKDFDPSGLVNTKEARRLDRNVLLALAAAVEAKDDASLNGFAPDRVGVVFGSAIGGFIGIMEQSEVFNERGPDRVSPYFIPSVLVDSASGQIAISLGIRGPNYAPVSACATGSHAVGEGAEIIRRGDADVILAGGTEACMHPLILAGFCAMRGLAAEDEDPPRASRPFDATRAGFVMGEGACVLVLEDLEAAKTRGAKIYAEVLGYGASNDAYHMAAPDPAAVGVAEMMRAALARARVNPGDVDYVNAHGTSTPLGDLAETNALKDVFGDHAYELAVSSTKSMMGHCFGAAGAIEAMMCVLAIHEGRSRRRSTTSTGTPSATWITCRTRRARRRSMSRSRTRWVSADTTAACSSAAFPTDVSRRALDRRYCNYCASGVKAMRGPTGPRGDIHEGGKRMRTKVLLAAAFATLLCSLVAASSLLASTTRAGATRPASSAVMAAGQNSAIAQATRALSPLAWIPAAPYPTSIVRYAFAQVDENLYVIGGVSDGSVVSAVNVYNATTNTWSPLAPIPVASEGPAGAYLNGKIYVADGLGSAAMHIYDVAGNSWTTGASRPSGDSYGAAAGAYNGKVYVVGGSGSGPTSTLDIYDIATDSWTSGPSAPAPYLLGGYHQVGQYLYIIGSFGAGGPGLNSNVSMRLDMATNTWTTGPTWTPNRADFGLALGGTKLYALGGDTSGGGYFDPSSQVDELDISTWPAGTWTASPPNLASARQANQAGFTSTGRAGGEIWSTGGLAPGFVFIPEHTIACSRLRRHHHRLRHLHHRHHHRLCDLHHRLRHLHHRLRHLRHHHRRRLHRCGARAAGDWNDTGSGPHADPLQALLRRPCSSRTLHARRSGHRAEPTAWIGQGTWVPRQPRGWPQVKQSLGEPGRPSKGRPGSLISAIPVSPRR